MTVDEYLAWAMDQPGRHELHAGEVFAMAPETSRHAKAKFAVQTVLANEIRKRNLSCHMLPDGMTVRIDKDTAYEPDALVYCGGELAADAIEVPNPVIIVEILSPSTRHVDLAAKLAAYFRLPSVAHYLIVDAAKRYVIHHARGGGGDILTRIVAEGSITLDPPGLELALDAVFGR